jgi:hypothetical protein
MTALIRSELLALRTLRTWAVPAVLIALVAVIVTASFADAGSPGLTTPAQLREILGCHGGHPVCRRNGPVRCDACRR